MIKAILIDDETGNLELMKGLLQTYCTQVTVMAQATTINTAAALIEQHQPDLVFLDVEMNNESGFDLFKHFPKPNFQVIFATAHEKYALQAIKSSCLEFLLKPIDHRELTTAVEKFEKQQVTINQKKIEILLANIGNVKQQLDKIAIPTTDGFIFLNTNDLLYCEASNNYTIFCTNKNERITSSKTLKEYEEMLNPEVFFRCHKSWLINLNGVKKFSRTEGFRVQMQNDTWIDISVRKKEEFLKIFEKH